MEDTQGVQLPNADDTQLPETEDTQLPKEAEGEVTVEAAEKVAEAAAPEGEVQEPKLRTEEEFSKMQSSLRKQIAEQQQRVATFEAQQRRWQQEQQLRELQHQDELAVQRQIEAGQIDESQKQTQIAYLQEQRQQQYTMAMQSKILQARELALKHSIEPSILESATTPQHAESLAELAALRKEVEALKLGKSKLEAAQIPPMKVDGGVPSGGRHTVDQVRDDYGDGRIDHKTYADRMRALGKEP